MTCAVEQRSGEDGVTFDPLDGVDEGRLGDVEVCYSHLECRVVPLHEGRLPEEDDGAR